jgi:endo-1,4-beta-xylanase
MRRISNVRPWLSAARPRFLVALALVAAAGIAVTAMIATGAVSGCSRAPEQDQPPGPADSAAGQAAQLPVLGAAVDWDKLRQPGPYQRLFLSRYTALTPEIAMKMDALAPTPDGLALDDAEELVRWAERHGITVHGHTLVWHNQVPGWLASRSWTRAELRAFLKRYIQAVVGHFRGRIPTWDVVNEPLEEDGSLRQSIWYRVLGGDYIADALRWAHEADPRAELFINEFNVERPGPKADAFVRLLAELRRDGVPLHGVGLQSHLSPSWRPSARELEETMRRFADLGLGVDISELDVEIGPGKAALAGQAEIYRTVAVACRNLAACERFTTWGFTDASTWLGTARRPLPFAADGSPKPAWRAIAAELLP